MPKTKEEVRIIIIRAIGSAISTLSNEPYFQIEGEEGGKSVKEEISFAMLCEVAPEHVTAENLAMLPATFTKIALSQLDEEDAPFVLEVFDEIGRQMEIWAPAKTKLSASIEATESGASEVLATADSLFGKETVEGS